MTPLAHNPQNMLEEVHQALGDLHKVSTLGLRTPGWEVSSIF
jgi:hypothetical protein